MDELIKLKENIFERARIFIEDIGSFAPFAAKLNENGIKDVMAYKEFKTTIDSQELIDMLKGNITKEINGKIIQAGAIAYDVSINLKNSDGIVEKRDALCLIITKDGINWEEEYYPYLLLNNQCIWK